MAFRDQSEALRQRAETLETELEAAQKELAGHRGQAERVARIEEDLAQARELLERVEGRLGKPAATSRRRRSRIVLGVAASLILVVAGVMAFRRHSRTGPPFYPPARHAPEPQPEATAAPPAEVAERPVMEKRARWNGRVRTTTGHQSIAIGTACTIDAILRSSSKHEASISCGGEVLYRSTDPVDGSPAAVKATAVEVPGMRPGTSESVLLLEDTHARRDGRAKASVNGARGVAEVRGLPPRAFVVEIGFEPYSEPYEGAFESWHKHAELPFQERVHTKARVTKASGPAPAKLGDLCEATLRPGFSGGCRAFIRCGRVSLHGDDPGGGERSACKVENGSVTLFDAPGDRWRAGALWDIPGGKLGLDSAEVDGIWNLELTAERPAGG